jgi:hypothetical protein
MNSKAKTLTKEQRVKLPSDEEISHLEENIVRCIEDARKNGKLENIPVLTDLYLRVQENKGKLIFWKERELENLRKEKLNNTIDIWKKVLSIIVTIILIPLGIYVYVYKDPNMGTFILGAGLSSAGLAGFINSDFVKNLTKNRSL